MLRASVSAVVKLCDQKHPMKDKFVQDYSSRGIFMAIGRHGSRPLEQEAEGVTSSTASQKQSEHTVKGFPRDSLPPATSHL